MRKIMVVDDDANIRAVLKLRLGRSRYAVQMARNGTEAMHWGPLDSLASLSALAS